MKRHKHYNEIVAWANGEEIQFFSDGCYVEWRDVRHPSWDELLEYRVKPKDVVKEVRIMFDEDEVFVYVPTVFPPNVAFTFDSETDELKGVELL